MNAGKLSLSGRDDEFRQSETLPQSVNDIGAKSTHAEPSTWSMLLYCYYILTQESIRYVDQLANASLLLKLPFS